MEYSEKEKRRVRYDDLYSGLQDRIDRIIYKSDSVWIDLNKTINSINNVIEEGLKPLVTINQSANQLITVTCNGIKYTNSFKITKGTPYTIEFKLTNPNYIIGELNIPVSGIVIDDMTIQATPAIPIIHTVSITQVDNQTIYVICNGKKYSSTFTIQQGTKYTTEIVPDAWYAVGKIQGASSEGTVQTDMNITASAATERPSYDLNIVVGHYPSTNPNVYGLDCTYKWGGSKDPEYHFGEISEDNIIDIFSANTNSAYLAFWGGGKPPVTFNSVSAYLYTNNGSKKYTICENLPYTSLNSHGDIESNYLSIKAIDLYNIFKANDGKKINLRLKLNK